MQKLLSKEFEFVIISLEILINTDDHADYGYFIVCDIEYTDVEREIIHCC